MNSESKVHAKATHSFHAPAERVFEAWLKPETIGTWMFGPGIREEEVIHLKNDPQVGGKFSYLVNRQGVDLDHIGEYLKITPPSHLEFTWGVRQDQGATSRVIIDIAPNAQGCELTLDHEMDEAWADFVSRVEGSWTKMLNALDAALK